MKKIIGIIIASLVLCNIAFAGFHSKYFKILKGWSYYEDVTTLNHRYHVATICVDNYKFAISNPGEGTTMVQFFEERDGKSLPAKC